MKSNLVDEHLAGRSKWGLAASLVALMLQTACGTNAVDDAGGTAGAGGSGGNAGNSGAIDGDDPRNWGVLEKEKASASESAAPPAVSATACSNGAECPSGFCVDGVCCDTACIGTCQACSAAKKGSGADGTCGVIALYGDPDSECLDGSCDGSGSCKSYNGAVCSAANTCLSGNCADGFCCGNACDGPCRACSVAKRGTGYNGQCGPIAANTDPDSECNGGTCNGSTGCSNLGSGNTCSVNGDCASGFCVDGVCCSSACSNMCEACSAAKKGSGVDGTCGPIAANTNPDGECIDGKCNGSGGCIRYNGAVCTTSAECMSTYCVDGFCCGNACTDTCKSCSAAKNGTGYNGQCLPIAANTDPDNECPTGDCSGSGSCTMLQVNGAVCTTGASCASGNCVDGVCCNAACTGTCQACTAAKKGSGTDGTCGTMKYDFDPDNECASGSCSGSGTCQYYNGLTCAAATECLSGNCVDGYCCGNACTGTCSSCSAAKKGSGVNGVCGVIAANTDPDNECGNNCNGSGLCEPQANGGACTSTAECISGLCVDGVCCNNACTGACMACNNPGAIGTCTPGCSPHCSGTIGLPNAPMTPLPSVGTDIRATAIADFDGNGTFDVATADYGTNSVAVLLNQGGGNLGTKVDYATGANPIHVAARDVNGDAKLDIVTVNFTAATMSVLLNLGNGTFASKVDYATGASPQSVAIGDLNGDGSADVVVVNAQGGVSPANDAVSVLLNQGNGTFAPRVNYGSWGVGTKSVSLADLNNDAKLDIVSLTPDFVRVMLNAGNGTFGAPVATYQAQAGVECTTGDLNGDGKPDVAVANQKNPAYNNPGINVYLNNGSGTLATPVNYAGAEVRSIFAGDVTQDGKLDLITSNFGNLLSIRPNLGTGTFGAPVVYPTRGDNRDAAVVDMNADGKNDLVAANATSILVMPNLGAGNFGTGSGNFNTLASSIKAITADFNADGRMDVAMTSQVSPTNKVSVMLANGNGTFGARTDYSVGSQPTGLVAADFNGDGKPDLAVINRFGKTMSVLRNSGNGTFTGPTTYAISEYPASIVAGDFTNDGKIDLAVYSFKASYDFSGGPANPIPSNNVFTMFVNNGSGSFTALPTSTFYTRFNSPQEGLSTAAIAAKDFTGDGTLDIAIAIPDLQVVRIWIGQANGTFVSLNSYSIAFPYAVALADLGGDGKDDLIVNTLSGALLVMPNLGSGNFGAATTFTGGGEMAVGDIDGNYKPDLAFTTGEDGVSISLNQGNGTLGAPILYSSGGAGPISVSIADMNNDTKSDLVLLNQGSNLVSVLNHNCL